MPDEKQGRAATLTDQLHTNWPEVKLLQTPAGSVRIATTPRAVMGTNRYLRVAHRVLVGGNRPKPGEPRPNAAKTPLPYYKWEFEPLHLDPVHPTRWDVPAWLKNWDEPWAKVLCELYENPLSFPASISPEGGLMLHSIIRNTAPKVVIETGTFIGISALWIAAALKERGGVLHSFDNFLPIEPGPWRNASLDNRLQWVADKVSRAGLADNVVFHEGNSSVEINAYRKRLQAAGGVQVAFLDADHTPPGVWLDFAATEHVLQTGGLVILHDTYPSLCSHSGPRELLDTVNEKATGFYQTLDLNLAPLNYGLGVLRRIG